MTNEERQAEMGRWLLQLGVLLFFIGLLIGFALPVAANPRMALSSHLEGVMNGLFLLALGAIWHRLRLGAQAQRAAFGLISLSGAMLVVCPMVLWGLRGRTHA